MEAPLTSSEISTLRRIIAEYNARTEDCSDLIMPDVPTSNLFASEEPEEKPIASIEINEDDQLSKKEICFQLLKGQNLSDETEVELVNKSIEAMEGLSEEDIMKVTGALLGLSPYKRYIRQGTPEQKMFALKSIGDRFLEGIISLAWPKRAGLLKAVSKYLTNLSQTYAFLTTEEEDFNPLMHERVSGSSGTSGLVKEMRTFLVVSKTTMKVVYLGQVLT